MRKPLLFCLLIVLSISVNAQISGPTKEQTVEYIIMNMSTITTVNENHSSNLPARGIFYQYIDQINNTYFKDCTLYFTMKTKDDLGEKTVARKIDFSKVEDIHMYIKNGLDGGIVRGGEIIRCNTIERVDGKARTVSVVMLVLDSEKMMKALNHLRKLCGAPEPIKF